MTDERHRSRNDDRLGAQLIDEVLSRANPNPERLGCPGRDVLVKLADRTLLIDDPGYVHLTKCSPCYREFLELKRTQHND